MSDIEFIDGLMVKAPNEKAPDFVKGSISIKRKDLGNWLRGKSEDWINLDIKESKGGKWYASVNSWKPEQDSVSQSAQSDTQPPVNNDFDDDIPF